ncbi:MAG: right-handed parallel beta-helix repeat-containing protein, partial [Candidatus Saccharibacteria bacterium]|nr:right-handed parallel beta-helix repeat-containing protein [Pseudorhodobacter sp.]
GSSLILYRTLNATARGYVFTGKMPTNAIRLVEGSADGIITDNIILGGKHAGILIGNGSTGAQIANNIVWKRDGGAISVLRSDCGRLTGNTIVDNRQKGIEVRVSLDTKIEANTVLSNQNAGIWVAGQAVGAQTYLTRNVLAANNAGITGAIGENIHLDGNDFSNQFPQFLSGDLTAQFQSIAMDLHGLKPIQLVAANSGKHKPINADCSK